MIYAFDTYYFENFAKTVCIAFDAWGSETETEIFTEKTTVSAGYESGAFIKESFRAF